MKWSYLDTTWSSVRDPSLCAPKLSSTVSGATSASAAATPELIRARHKRPASQNIRSIPSCQRANKSNHYFLYFSMDSEGAISSTGDVPNFLTSKKKLDLQSRGSAGHWRPIRVQHIKNRSQSSRVEWQTIVQQINTFYPARNADLQLCNATAYFRPSCVRT